MSPLLTHKESNLSLFPVDRNSKISIAVQPREEAGPCPDENKRSHISHPSSQGHLDFQTRKLFGGLKRNYAKFTHKLFW